MLIHESQLVQTQSPTILDMLDEAVFLTEDESKVTAAQIPVIVKESTDSYMVDLNDIQSVSESCNMNYFESIQSISEANDIDMSKIVVAVDEGDAILLGESFDPEHMVVRPIQEANDEYQICLEAIEYCLETGDFDSLDSILLFEDAHKRSLKKAAKLAGYSQEELKKAEDTQRDPEETKIRNLSPEAQRGVPAHLLGAPKGGSTTSRKADKEEKKISQDAVKHSNKSVPSWVSPSTKKDVEEKRETNKAIEQKKHEEGTAKAALPKLSHRPAKPKGSENWGAKKDSDNQSDWAAWADKKHEENNKPVKTDDVANKAGSSNLPQVSNLGQKPESIFKPKAQSNNLPAVAQSSSPTASGKPSSDGEMKNITPGGPHVPAVAAASSPDISDAKVSGSNNMLKYGAAAAGGAALAGGAWYAYKKYKNQPKSVIGKRIAALRQIYAKFMKKAQSSHDSGVAANLKKVAAKVLSVIDKLMGYLQNKAG